MARQGEGPHVNQDPRQDVEKITSVAQLLNKLDALPAQVEGDTLWVNEYRTDTRARKIEEGGRYSVLERPEFVANEGDAIGQLEPAGAFQVVSEHPSEHYKALGYPEIETTWHAVDPLTAEFGEPYIQTGFPKDAVVVARYARQQSDGPKEYVYRVGGRVNTPESAVWVLGEDQFVTVQTVGEMEPGLNFGETLGYWAESSNVAERSYAISAMLRLAEQAE